MIGLAFRRKPAHNGPPQKKVRPSLLQIDRLVGKAVAPKAAGGRVRVRSAAARARADGHTQTHRHKHRYRHTHTRELNAFLKKFPMTSPLRREKGGGRIIQEKRNATCICIHSLFFFSLRLRKLDYIYIHIILF